LLIFVAAERRELEGLLRHVHKIQKVNWPLDFARRGMLNGKEVALVANGPGPNLAGAAVDVVSERATMGGLVSTGFCGGLTRELEAGDIFLATEVVGVAAASIPSTDRSFKTGKLLSLDRVVSTAAEKAGLASQADAVEMEAGAVAARARQYSVPFYAVRVVTDRWRDSFPLDFNELRSAGGHFSRAKILAAALRKPGVLPNLVQLNKTTKRAALALGDFLADARF